MTITFLILIKKLEEIERKAVVMEEVRDRRSSKDSKYFWNQLLMPQKELLITEKTVVIETNDRGFKNGSQYFKNRLLVP